MALTGSVGITIEIKSPADKFYDLWKTQAYHLPNISSDYIKNIDVQEGDWHLDGSVKLWTYTLDGKTLSLKERVAFDDASKTLTFHVLEGDLVNDFKSFTSNIKVIPNEDGNGGVVKVTVDFEKLRANVPVPDDYVTLAENVIKDVDAHLLSN